MLDATSRTEWRLAHCNGCRLSTNHRRVDPGRYRCVRCSTERGLPEDADHRERLADPDMPSPPPRPL